MSVPTLAIALSTAFPALAEVNERDVSPERFSAEMALGSLSGKTRERVYDPDAGGQKVSQLDWSYNNASIITGSLDWTLIPELSIGASGWTTLSGRGGYMRDTDWSADKNQSWTDQSTHPNTRLNYANQFDINATLWLLNAPDYRLGMIGGYQESRYSFNAYGGSYRYTDEYTGLMDIGDFPADSKVIGYQQHYKMPYIGLVGRYRYQRFEFGASFKYSSWVRATDNDEHYLTDTTFRTSTKRQNFYSLSGNAGYYVTPTMKIFLEGTWNRVANKRGNISANDYGAGEKYYADNSGGIENYNYMLSIGMKYRF